ncbi:MAG: hypothetical protein ACO22L_06660, partial [Candidatus Nanopelagicaceae bacterium]
MSLYGRTDSNDNLDKVLDANGLVNVLPQADVYFVDDTEASLAENASRGITGPGWWSYYTYTDSDGNTRHKAEHLAFISNPDTNANETQTDDDVAADVTSTITISTQPADASIAEGSDTFFAVIASASIGDLFYVWQRRTSASGRWTNISATLDGAVYSNFDTDTLDISDVTGLDAHEYRVKLTSDAGAEEVISDAAVLT